MKFIGLPKPDADYDARHVAQEDLLRQFQEETRLPPDSFVRQLAMARIQSPERPPYPLPTGWSRWWPDLRDDPSYAASWAQDHELLETTEELRRGIHERAAAADAQRAQAQEQAAQQERDAELAGLTAELRRRYLATPGGTDETFEQALPGLLENHRRRMLESDSTVDDLARRRQIAQTKL